MSTKKETTAKKTAPKKGAEKKEAPVKKTAAKKETAEPAKEEKPKKEKVVKEKKQRPYGISDLLKEIMVPAEGTICAVSYSEANKAVMEKFPERKKLYQSEFERNFTALKDAGKLTEKKPAAFKAPKEKKEPAEKKGKKASKKNEAPAAEAEEGATSAE